MLMGVGGFRLPAGWNGGSRKGVGGPEEDRRCPPLGSPRHGPPRWGLLSLDRRIAGPWRTMGADMDRVRGPQTRGNPINSSWTAAAAAVMHPDMTLFPCPVGGFPVGRGNRLVGPPLSNVNSALPSALLPTCEDGSGALLVAVPPQSGYPS